MALLMTYLVTLSMTPVTAPSAEKRIVVFKEDRVCSQPTLEDDEAFIATHVEVLASGSPHMIPTT